MLEVSPEYLRRLSQPTISVVVPAYNEAPGLGAFHQRLLQALAGVASWEVVYVDDGSTDDTLATLEALQLADRRVGVVSLSRNFGKERAREGAGRAFPEERRRSSPLKKSAW